MWSQAAETPHNKLLLALRVPAEMATTRFPERAPPTSWEASAGSMDLQVSTAPSAVTADEWAAPAAMRQAVGLDTSLCPL